MILTAIPNPLSLEVPGSRTVIGMTRDKSLRGFEIASEALASEENVVERKQIYFG